MLLLLVRHGLHQDGGTFVYPLDDAYIHLAVSRNLAIHGVWGISPYSFSGASSSPGWTLLLALTTRLAGVQLLAPLYLNVAAALVLLLLASIVLERKLPQAGIGYIALALCAVVLVTPMPGVALIGMEHILHAAAVLCFACSASAILSLSLVEETPHSTATLLVISAFACGLLRYESCFVIAVVIVLLLARSRAITAVLVAFAAAVGPLGYGLYSRAHSGIALPFSVVMKAASPADRHPLNALFSSDTSPIVLALAVVFFMRLARRALEPKELRSSYWTYGNSLLVIAFATCLLHVEIGPSGWLMRYEAYLYALGFVAIALAVREAPALIKREETLPQRWFEITLLVALAPAVLGIFGRIHHGYSDFKASIRDRYVEHLPQALFVEQQMPHAVVLANDIGFLAFYADHARILDPLGLGSIEPVELERQHRSVNPEFIADWTSRMHADLAILHTDFPHMEAIIPAGWVPVESWCFPHNLVFSNHVETFYVPDQASAAVLRTRLAGFHQLAPEIVRYRFPADGSGPPQPPRGETAVCPVHASGR